MRVWVCVCVWQKEIDDALCPIFVVQLFLFTTANKSLCQKLCFTLKNPSTKSLPWQSVSVWNFTLGRLSVIVPGSEAVPVNDHVKALVGNIIEFLYLRWTASALLYLQHTCEARIVRMSLQSTSFTLSLLWQRRSVSAFKHTHTYTHF